LHRLGSPKIPFRSPPRRITEAPDTRTT
jgi:hypothetical protein